MNKLLNTGTDFRISVMYIIAAFVLYYIFLLFLKKSQEKKQNNTRSVIIGRSTGVFLFGILPVIYLMSQKMNIKEFGINSENLLISLYAILIVLPIIFIVVFINAKKEQNLKLYPEIRKQTWNAQLLILSAFSWLVYIFAYEFLFRGFFLFLSLQYFSYWPAIIINIILYALVHIPKGIKETVASLPFGLILCVITIESGNITASFVIHGFMGLFNEWLSLKAHPNMQLK